MRSYVELEARGMGLLYFVRGALLKEGVLL